MSICYGSGTLLSRIINGHERPDPLLQELFVLVSLQRLGPLLSSPVFYRLSCSLRFPCCLSPSTFFLEGVGFSYNFILRLNSCSF